MVRVGEVSAVGRQRGLRGLLRTAGMLVGERVDASLRVPAVAALQGPADSLWTCPRSPPWLHVVAPD